jgi:hypothetical protein
VGKLGTDIVVERLPTTWLQSLDVLIQRVHEHPERQVPFELGGKAREHELIAVVGTGGQLGKQSGLADAGFAHQLDCFPFPAHQLGQGAIEECELLGAADGRGGSNAHLPSASQPKPSGGQRSRREKSGCHPDVASGGASHARRVPMFVLHHRHAAEDCGAAYASFKGGNSPLRHRAALASCGDGGHAMWWTVEAADEVEALGLLPYFVVERTTAAKEAQIDIP